MRSDERVTPCRAQGVSARRAPANSRDRCAEAESGIVVYSEVKINLKVIGKVTKNFKEARRFRGRAGIGRAERHRYGFKINEGTGRRHRSAGRGGAGPRGELRQSASGPRPRGRRLSVVRRTGVSPRERVPRRGGEPRAARARSAPTHRDSRAPDRRARSQPVVPLPPGPTPAPRLRPVFLWARQLEGTVQEVRCEDYDPRNRIRIARTDTGWRVIPRTEIYNSIRIPPRERRKRRRRRRSGRPRRRPAPATPPAWLARDLESHIPSHTIAVPRAPVPRSPSPPAPSEPTPLDNLLAVAELEFNQQRGERVLDLDTFLPEEEVARGVMSFELGETSKTNDEMFYERKAHVAAERSAVDDAFQNNMVVHKDLFETISEAHYLPDLSGPHDEDLLESLVEKGCEDNQILGQALDKLAHLVHGSGDYAEEEDDMLLGSAPVTDIIDRLEQSLESPGRSSITAAQGLLHLHHIGDHLPPMEHQQNVEPAYLTDEVFASENPSECTLVTLTSVSETQAANLIKHIDFEPNPEKILDSNIESTNIMYTVPVPDTREICEDNAVLEQSHSSHDQSEIPSETTNPKSAVINEQITNTCSNGNVTMCNTNDQNAAVTKIDNIDFAKELSESSNSEELLPTDLSIKHIEHSIIPHVVTSIAEMTNSMEDNLSEKSDEQPKDLSVHRRLPTPHASPRRLEMVRAPSRESDAMQSPQPSGIPAIPSSPEIFSMPTTSKSKQALFLETLLSSPSPKMYTSEVTITKQQCKPLNLGKHRKSASPTVSSCSDEIRKLNKDFGEPPEKRIKRESVEDLAKISKVFNKSCEDQLESKPNKSEKTAHKSGDETSPLKQLQVLKTSPDFNIPDPLLVPKDKLNHILAAPGREIPALLIQRPELRLPEAFAFPAILQDPDILVISLSQLESILENDAKKLISHKPMESKPIIKSSSSTEKNATPQPDQSSQPKPIPSMDALAGDIDAATSATLNQMLWLPYLSQLEAMAACSQNMDFIKALNSTGYTGQNYPDVSQMFNPSARFLGPTGFPMMPPMDYDSRLQFAMWQEAMNQANASSSQRSKSNAATEVPTKESASKSSDVQNPYVHSTKNHQSKPHSSARTSPIAHNYNNNQRTMNHNHFLQSMYPGMNPNIRHNLPLPGLQIPYFNPNLMGNQRSPRTGQQKSPTSPYFPNNNYLHSVKHSEGTQRSSSAGSQESPRPRISVRSLHNMMEPNSSAGSSVGSSGRRSSNTPVSSSARRREEPEVGSTTPLGELPPVPHLPPHLPPHPHDPSSFHLWHPLFGNQKSYNSPWSWTTVTATGD